MTFEVDATARTGASEIAARVAGHNRGWCAAHSHSRSALIIVETEDRLSGRGNVTDRFEVDFDWNQQEYMLVGKPVIRNFSSKVGAVLAVRCPATATGTFELARV